MAKFAWLIEAGGSQPCAPLYLLHHGDRVISWTHDHDAASKFGSRGEAETFAEAHVSGDIRACEHGWN